MRKTHGTASVGLSEETKRNIYFYHHSIEDHIASLAEQAGDKNLVAPITAELVRLLEAKALWETFRNTQSLPEMRTQRNGDRPGGWPGSAARALAADLSGNASGNRSLSAKGRKAISKAQKLRWRKQKGLVHRSSETAEERRARQRAAYRAKREAEGRAVAFSPEHRERMRRAQQKRLKNPAERKRMLYHMEKMRAARRKKIKNQPKSEEHRAKLSSKAMTAYWANMTEEQRKWESARRRKVREENKAQSKAPAGAA